MKYSLDGVKGQRPFKILMIAPTSFFADYGCHVRILEESLILQRLGHAVTVVTYYKGRPVADLRIVRTPPLPWRSDYEVGSSRHKFAFDAFLSYVSLWTALKTRPDIIHGHLHEGALIGAPLARLLGVPLIFDLQGSMTAEMVDHRFLDPQGPFFKPAVQLEKLINRVPQAILTSSSHSRQMLMDEFEVPAARIHALPDCVNADIFKPGLPERVTLKQRLNIPPERPVVIYLGLLAEYQGTHFLVQSAAQLKAAGVDAHFLIMGYPNFPYYQHMAKELGVADRVTLPGRIPYEQAAAYLSIGDVAVAPKLSSTEGSGKVLNYMAMGLPTVAFDTPVQREYLNDLGVYAAPGDLDGLTAGIRGLLEDPQRRLKLGSALRQRAIEHYAWERAGRQIEGLYTQLYAASRRGRREKR